MVITRRIPTDELLRRTIRDLNLTEPAGHPTEEEIQKQNKEFQSYRLQREPQILRDHMRKQRFKRGASQ